MRSFPNITILCKRQAHRRPDGFALTLTLILVALTAIVVIAFLTTTSTERTTAAAYARVEKAREMAEAGADAAIARVITEMKYRPYHAIGYRSVTVGNFGSPPAPLTEIIPVITGPRTTNPATPTYNTAPNATEDVYLMSVIGGGIPGSAAPTSLTTTNSVDLNANHLASEPKGWIGSPTSAATPIPFRAPWVDVLQDPTKAMQPDSSQPNYNPVIGRYAYWIEDETSKLDISIVGNGDSVGGFQRGDGVDRPDTTPTRLAVNDLDIGALPLIGGTPLPSGDVTTNPAIMNLRAILPMTDARFLNRVTGLAPDVHETIKFYATAFGLSDDLAGNGRRRANINALVTNPASPNPAVLPGTIAGNIDDIAYVISGTHLLNAGLGPSPSPDNRVFKAAPDNFTNTLTTFGTRFFSSPAPTANEQAMYLERIAANIRDYVDTDQQPTYIDTSDQVQSGARINVSWRSGSEPRALGKEAIPCLQEHGWVGYEISMDGTDTTTPRNYVVETDHYLEFVNPNNKDFTAPSGTIIHIYNRPSWDAGTFSPLQLPDIDLDVSGQTFPAGQAMVITTAPAASDPPGLLQNSHVIRINTPNSLRYFSGQTDHRADGRGYGTPGPYGLELIGRSGSTHVSDYATEMVWGTANGIFDGHAYLGFGGTVNNHTVWDYIGNNGGSRSPDEVANRRRFVFTASLRGNDQPGRTGDARSLSEQMSMLGGLSSLGNDQTRFYSNIDGDSNIPNTSTFGRAQISFVNPTQWPDYTPAFADTAATSFASIRDGPIQSIAELGHIYDPHREPSADTSPTPTPAPATRIQQARGGGRTLKIGQSDDLMTGARFSASWSNSAWRLVDLFAADLNKDGAGAYVKVANPTSRGRLNINGVFRDNGAGFRAALRSFIFSTAPNGDPQLGGNSLSSAEATALTNDIVNYLTTNGPMLERGELSQLPFFNTGTAGGISMSTTNDRGREELFRRLVETITTRSAAFTVYVIGESVRQDKNGAVNTVGQRRLAVTFQLEPQTGGSSLQNSATPHAIADSYRVKKLYAPN